VVVSILPLHSLAAAVMQGAGTPQLLVDGGSSPHAYSLRPSAAGALNEADLVVWVGPEMESFLVQPLARHPGRVLTLLEAPGVRVLAGAHQADSGPGPGHPHASGERDPHIWLDPRNAIAAAAAMTQVLSELDPERGGLYRANGERLQARLRGLDQGLEQRLQPLRGRPFLVFHDAYRYLEARYGLHSVGAVVTGPERRPGARRVRELRARIKASGARCVFSEPQFQSSLLTVLTEDSHARAAVLDPVGADLEPGPDAYFRLMNRLADQLVGCLQDPPGGAPDD
jgi:zinc transport system substrate-binding protein